MNAIWHKNGWWVRRLLMLPVHILVFAVIVFFAVRLLPGDPVATLFAGQQVTQEQMDVVREQMGLSGTIFDQLIRYFANLFTLDFGTSLADDSDVGEQIGIRFPATVEIALISTGFAALVTVLLGLLVLLKPRNPFSRLASFYARTAGAIPDFCLGVAGILLFYTVLRWAPAPIGRYDPMLIAAPKVTGFPLLDAAIAGDLRLFGSMLEHLWLPLLVLVIANVPLLLKIFIRALERTRVDDITLFRAASGVSTAMLVTSIVRRSLPSMVTMLGMLFGFLVGGAVIIEQLFALPGMGQYLVRAVSRTDYVVIQGFIIIVSAASLFVYFLVDIMNMLLDPRRRTGVTSEGE